jgi:hypothetical protein
MKFKVNMGLMCVIALSATPITVFARAWAEAAGLTNFNLAGKGALSADDPKVGQGVRLWFAKQ